MKYLIIGASAAGLSCGKTLRELDPLGEILVVSKDTKIYSRCMLHLFLSFKRDLESLNFLEEDFFQRYDIGWRPGREVVQLYPREKYALLDDGSREYYDKVLIASGASPIIPSNIKNIDRAKGVYVLRNLEDAYRIRQMLLESESAIILGGGLIGIDIATEIISTGIGLNLIEYGNNILALQLDRRASQPYEDKLKKSGSKIYYNCLIDHLVLDDQDQILGIKLTDGRFVEGQNLIISAGVRPNTDFLDSTGIELIERDLELEWGIVVNERCESNLPDVYAAGDVCAGHENIWPLAVRQGRGAAYNMAGKERLVEDLFGFRNAMNFFGLNTVSLGDPNLELEGLVSEVYDDGLNYQKLVHKDGRLMSAIFQGQLPYPGIYESLIKKGLDLRLVAKEDLFKIGYGDFFKLDENGEFAYRKLGPLEDPSQEPRP